MSENRESNSNAWQTGGVHSNASATNLSKIYIYPLNPDGKLDHNRLSDFNIEEACTKTELQVLPKVEAESLPNDASNTSEFLFTSEAVAPKDSTDPLANVKEEIMTNFNLNSVSSEDISPTTSKAASVRIEMNRQSPVVVLEPFPYPTTCLEMVTGDRSSTEVADFTKNGRKNPSRKSGSPSVVTKFKRTTFSISNETRKSVPKNSVKHVRSDRKKLSEFEQCDKSFTREGHLEAFMLPHIREKRYTCGLCDKSFSQKSSLKRHMVTHTGEKRYTCWQCAKSFSQKDHLKGHLSIHTGEMLYRCVQCDKSFSQKRSLKAHMVIHTGEKQFLCWQCGKSFSQKSRLESHMTIHTGEKRYTCGQCDKLFSQKSKLITHMVTHTGEKGYTCCQCGKSFSQKVNLKSHMPMHTGEMLYRCGQCDKSFSHKHSLKRHKVIHTGEKPYVCWQCGKSFSQKSNLERHMVTHRKECTDVGSAISHSVRKVN